MTSYFNACDVAVAYSNQKNLPKYFRRALVPSHFEKGSATHDHYATYFSCSYVVNSIHEYFIETDLRLQISQH